MLQAAYTTPKLAAKDTHALTNLVAVTILIKILILFTAVALREE
jgi:hypothetical protein